MKKPSEEREARYEEEIESASASSLSLSGRVVYWEGDGTMKGSVDASD